MIRLRRLLPFALAVALLALPAIAIAGTNAQAGRQIQVNVVDNAFEPKAITVNAGDTVVWTNNGNRNHTVTASDGSWDSGQLAPGQTFSHTFATAGTVPYYCRPHGTPDGQGMAGTVMVQAASTGAAQAPAAGQQPAQATPSRPAPQAAGTTPSLEAMDQPIADGSVTVNKVVAAQDGWLVIHTNTPDNQPGPVIGHTAVKAGENADVKVALSQMPNQGDKLWPMLHIDAGQTGVYEFPGADAPVIVNGDIVMKQITVQAPGGAAQAPRALPSTGEASPSSLWIAPLIVAVALLLGGTLLLATSATNRR